jgi:hypothetical protein
MSDRKVVCVQYETGKTVSIKKNGRDIRVPETRLLTVGSAFFSTEDKNSGESRWMIQGRFNAVPPQWDGKFILLDPLPRSNGESGGESLAAEDVPF